MAISLYSSNVAGQSPTCLSRSTFRNCPRGAMWLRHVLWRSVPGSRPFPSPPVGHHDLGFLLRVVVRMDYRMLRTWTCEPPKLPHYLPCHIVAPGALPNSAERARSARCVYFSGSQRFSTIYGAACSYPCALAVGMLRIYYCTTLISCVPHVVQINYTMHLC